MANGSNLILGSESTAAWRANNTASATTKVTRSRGPAVTAFVIENLDGPAIQGTSPDDPGVAGTSTIGAGVHGTGRIGVEGQGGIGVHGEGSFVGAYGHASDGTGVWGGGRVGVLGASGAAEGVQGLSGTGTGVRGDAVRVGVAGFSSGTNLAPFSVASPAGVLGVSTSNGFGVRGRSDLAINLQRPGGVNIVGAGVLAESPTGTALVATARMPAPIGFAGVFIGDVRIVGNAVVTGNLGVVGNKNAAVRHPDGSHRLTFALESPESFFEDFGRSRVVRGRARVTIDGDFAGLVDRDGYYVFLAPEGESRGLYVSRKGRNSFEVREQQGGRSTLRFSYRLVARRKDVSHRRLPKISIPALRIDEPPPSDATARVARGRKARTLPDPLKELDRMVAASARKARRRPRGRKRARRR